LRELPAEPQLREQTTDQQSISSATEPRIEDYPRGPVVPPNRAADRDNRDRADQNDDDRCQATTEPEEQAQAQRPDQVELFLDRKRPHVAEARRQRKAAQPGVRVI